MQFDKGIQIISAALKNPLPGEQAQRLMSPVARKTMAELIQDSDSQRLSSVLMLLYPGNDGLLHTTFIERPQNDTIHSGQIAFPGGKVETTDLSIAAAALRETEEEIGVRAKSIQLIGSLTPLFIPASRYLVHPHIGMVETTPAFIPNKNEVQSIIEVDIDELLRLKPEAGTFKTSNGILPAPYFNLKGYHLWGATSMIVSEFRVIMQLSASG